MVKLELELKPFGLSGCGHFYISKVLIQQNILSINKRYRLVIEEV